VSSLKQLEADARQDDIPVMKDGGIAFLKELLVSHAEIQKILEVGTAVGCSSMEMASVRDDIVIDTLELDPERALQARQNIEACGYSDRIFVHQGDAAEYITMACYDLIFIDAAKSQYHRYTEHFLENSHVGTLFVYDNLAFHGIVDDPSLSHNRSTLQMTRKIKSFRDQLLNDGRFKTVFHEEIGDGIAVAIRL
jgi:predicted O-methyltransferase YrrM